MNLYVPNTLQNSTHLLYNSLQRARILKPLKTIRKAADSCVMVFVFESRKQEIIATHVQSGKCSEAKFQECLGLARKASLPMFEFYRQVIKLNSLKLKNLLECQKHLLLCFTIKVKHL